MKFVRLLLGVGLGLVLGAGAVLPVQADTTVPPLTIREVKITGDEFVVLQANQDVSLSDYWLGYSSSDTATGIVPTEQLPPQTLKSGQALLLTSDGAPTCDAVLIAKLSFSLSDSKGTLVVRQLASSGGVSTFTTVDGVNWAKSTSTTKTADPIDLSLESGLTYPVWYHADNGDPWQIGSFADCTETIAAAGSTPVTTITWPQNDIDPPAIIESLADDTTGTSGPSLPASDIGLLPPQVTELLPNPNGTGTDGTDEFVELYNPNDAAFDLSGFKLQTGLTTKHTYTFPSGTSLPPKSFVAFYSVDTGLTLSNTSGQADLTDPFGTVIAQTDPYGTAKDGQAWALAKGSWYWTGKPTPGTSNVINQSAAKMSSKTTSTKKSSGTVKGAVTSSGLASSTGPASDVTSPAPIHPVVLAAVAALALGYGVYEYRHDLANRLHQLRQHRAARRKARA